MSLKRSPRRIDASRAPVNADQQFREVGAVQPLSSRTAARGSPQAARKRSAHPGRLRSAADRQQFVVWRGPLLRRRAAETAAPWSDAAVRAASVQVRGYQEFVSLAAVESHASMRNSSPSARARWETARRRLVELEPLHSSPPGFRCGRTLPVETRARQRDRATPSPMGWSPLGD